MLIIQLGNPETSYAEDWQGLVDYAWSHAVVSDETYSTIKRSCNFSSDDPWSNDYCSKAVDEVFKQYEAIDIYSLYTPTCTPNATESEVERMPVRMFKSSSKMVSHINAMLLLDLFSSYIFRF